MAIISVSISDAHLACLDWGYHSLRRLVGKGDQYGIKDWLLLLRRWQIMALTMRRGHMLRSGNGLRSLYIHCARKLSYTLDKETIMWIHASTVIKTNHPQLDDWMNEWMNVYLNECLFGTATIIYTVILLKSRSTGTSRVRTIHRP